MADLGNKGVRSPYFLNYSDSNDPATAESSKVLLTINSTLRYTIIKNTGTTLRLDVSELVRDYVTPSFTGTFNTGSIGTASVSVAVSFYDDINATGTEVDTASDTFVAYDGYAYFSQQNNFAIPSGALLSGTTIYAPVNTTGTFYVMGGDGSLAIETYNTSATSAAGITIKRQPCDKYTPIKCVFINKFGVHQEFYFFAKKVESFNASGDKYISNIVANDGTYDPRRHQVVDFNKNGKINYNLSTGYVGQEVNPYIQELLLSEQIWLVLSGSVVPVSINTKSAEYKTTLNDKLVSYTMDFEQSNDTISTIK
jgi:hypothetical protein